MSLLANFTRWFWYLWGFMKTSVGAMVLILDGNSEIGAHVRSNFCYSICLKCSNRSKAVTNRIFSVWKKKFLHASATCYEFSSNISTMRKYDYKSEAVLRLKEDKSKNKYILRLNWFPITWSTNIPLLSRNEQKNFFCKDCGSV